MKYCTAILVVMLLSACADTDKRIVPGAPTDPPWGMDSLCENNPEECDETD